MTPLNEQRGWTAVVYAAQHGKESCLRLLIRQGAERRRAFVARELLLFGVHKHPLGVVRDRELFFPRMQPVSVYMGDCEVCSARMQTNAFTLRCVEGCTVNLCAKCEAEGRMKLGDGRTPLAWATLNAGPASSQADHAGCVRALLEPMIADGGALTPEAASEARTIIHDLARNSCFAELVRELVDADRGLASHKDDAERTPLQVATTECKAAIQEILFLLGRYDLASPNDPKHRSATCVVRPPPQAACSAAACVRLTPNCAAQVHFAMDTNAQPTKPCVLKFMRNQEQWQRELDVRGGAVEAGGAQRFEPAHVMPVLRSHTLTAVQAAAAFPGGEVYPFVLALERGDEDLSGAIAHARMSLPQARRVAGALAACVAHLHERGLIHGDLKPLNAVRCGRAWKLIDLDAATPVDSSDPGRSGFVGMKCSTAFAPPELLYCEPMEARDGVPRPVYGEAQLPVTAKQGGNEVVVATVTITADGTVRRTPAPGAPGAESVDRAPGGGGWRVKGVDAEGNPLDPRLEGKRVFDPLRASVAFDMWGLGAVAFEMLMRASLWHADTDSNILAPADYAALGRWDAAAAKAATSRVPDRWAQALLLRLLAPDPSQRPASVAAVLRHPFFTKDAVFRSNPLPEGLKNHCFVSHFQAGGGSL